MALKRVHDYDVGPAGQAKLKNVNALVNVSRLGLPNINFQNGKAYYDNGDICKDVPAWAWHDLSKCDPDKIKQLKIEFPDGWEADYAVWREEAEGQNRNS